MLSVHEAAASLDITTSRLYRLLKRTDNAGLGQRVTQNKREVLRLSPAAVETLRAQIAPRESERPTAHESHQRTRPTFRMIIIESDCELSDAIQDALRGISTRPP